MSTRPKTASNNELQTLREHTAGFGRPRSAGVLAVVLSSALLVVAFGSAPAWAKTKSTSPLVALAKIEKKVPSASVTLSETGSTLLYPLFDLWAPYYDHEHPNFTITPTSTGSGTGLADAIAGTVDIGASDAYLSPTDVSKDPSLENIPLAISAQMVNYNLPGFTGTLKLSGKVISDIYQGTITKWNASQIAALNPGVSLPDMTIVPIHRSDGSGDTFIFTTYLSDQDPTGWGTKISYGTTVAFPDVPGSVGEDGNGGMVSGCGATPGCIAYIGVSYRNQTEKANLGEAELLNGAGHYEALTSATVAAEAAAFAKTTPKSGTISLIDSKKATNGYPIINYEYAIVSSSQSSSTTAQAIRAFLAWTMDPSAAGGSSPVFLNQVNFEPLPTSAISVALKLIEKIS